MQRRPLGRSGLKVVPFAFGGSVFGWTADEPTSMALLDRCVDPGFDVIDPADVDARWAPGNQGGESAAIIGRWLKRRRGRDRLVIATRVGADRGGDRKGLSARWIMEAVEESLRRLATDPIDLRLSHWPDPAVGRAETLGADQRLIDAGQVRAIGVSNVDAIAARHRATPAPIARASLMARPRVTAAIASATSLAQLDDLLAAGRVELDTADLAQLDATR